MPTIPQTFTADHTLAFDAALRDAFAQLPLGSRRATSGLTLALNGHVSLYSTTEAHVTSSHSVKGEGGSVRSDHPSDFTLHPSAEVVYHVHARGGCDCPDGARRLIEMADAAPGQRGCKHWYAAVLTAMAHVNLAIKGYVPEAEQVWYPAVALDEEHYGWPGWAEEQADGSWWFEFHNHSGGYYTDVLSLELWERTPVHLQVWGETVRSWERWLQGEGAGHADS